MSGPTSLQRAPSCCQHRFRDNHRGHYRHCHHHHHYHNRSSWLGAAGENDTSPLTRLSCGLRRLVKKTSALWRDEWTVVVVDEASSQRLRTTRRDNDDETKFDENRASNGDEEVDEPRLFSPVAKLTAAERLGDGTADEAGADARPDSLSSWKFDCSRLAAQRQRCRRNGGRGLAANAFLLAAAIAFFALAIVLPPVSGTSSEKDEETRTRMGGTGTGTGTAIAPSAANSRPERIPLVDTRTTSAGTSADLTGSIDLLAALQLYNTTRTGVTQVPGLARLKPAYYLKGEERDLRLNEASFERAAALLRRVPEFTVAAALRQEEANSGTIVAFSHGNNRYLELQSSGRKDELRLHYVSRRDGAVHVEAFPFRLADGAWHRLALSISGSQVELLVDCHPLYRRLLRPGPPDTNFTLPQLQLWVGQRNAKHFLFKGALQDVKLIPGAHGYLSQCPQLDSSCPTCGQFSILQNTVEQLMHNLNELTRRLAAAEGRISKVEECECQKSCRSNGTVHEDGATWEKGCEQCSCVHGDIECRPTSCAPVTCKNPVIPPGQCCPVCLKQCYLHGVIYDHGEKVSPKQCVECDCFDGSFTCQRFDTETRCPPLPCPPSEQISVAEECCKFCPDVDECKQQGGSEGHHCNANTRCVNVVGSYTCECLPGYHRIDKFNCAELDECATGLHSCAEHATCINTAGSYYCVCKDGYAGDGYTCKPVCEQSCQNGGECVAPGRCSCRRGYIGNSCELDLDECASDLHRCHHSSTCFNMPGWYYCRCKPGYRSALHESNQGTQCLDIDECNDQTIERRHTCHPSARCVNTEGGYECSCPHRDEQQEGGVSTHETSSPDDQCRLSCWYEGREIANGESLAPAGNPCRRCDCKDGVVTCREPICDCSAPGSRRDKCCPQCDPAASCRHQELHHLVFRSGERWIYQCQTCECLYGEIDCWQMECPPVTCPNPVTEDGDCCPRCEDDPCARELPGSAALNGSAAVLTSPSARPQPCSYAGLLHESGSSWQDLHDKCTTCECKDGQLCCSYDYRCAGDLEDGWQSTVSSVKSRSGSLPGGAGALRPDVDSPKGALSTAIPEFSVVVPVVPVSVVGGRLGGRKTTSRAAGSVTGADRSDETTSGSSTSDTSEAFVAASVRRVPVLGDGDVVVGESRVYASRVDDSPVETTIETANSLDERAAVSLPAATPPSSPASKTAASLSAAAAAAAAKGFTALNNVKSARYSTSYLNDRKTGFASGSRRRPERGPRLINGGPTGHDAT